MEFVTKETLLHLFTVFLNQTDSRYARLRPQNSITAQGGIITVGNGLSLNGDTLSSTNSGGSGSDTNSGGGGVSTIGGGTFYSWRDSLISYIPCEQYPPKDQLGLLKTYKGGNIKVVETNDTSFYTDGATPLPGSAYSAFPGTTTYLGLTYTSSKITTITDKNPRTNDCWFFYPRSSIAKVKASGQNATILPNVLLTTDGKLRFRIGRDGEGNTIQGVSAEVFDFDAEVYADRPNHLAVIAKYANKVKTTKLAFNGTFILKADGYYGWIFQSDKTFYFGEYGAFNQIRFFNEEVWETNFAPPSLAEYTY